MHVREREKGRKMAEDESQWIQWCTTGHLEGDEAPSSTLFSSRSLFMVNLVIKLLLQVFYPLPCFILAAEAATTVPPGLRHPSAPEFGCRANGRTYVDGEAVPSRDPCGEFEVANVSSFTMKAFSPTLKLSNVSFSHWQRFLFIYYFLSLSLSLSLLLITSTIIICI